MKRVTFTDERGRNYEADLPAGVPESDAAMGLVIGPPPLDDLDLPDDVATRLHNQLHARAIFTLRDAKARRQDIQGAIQAAIKLDVQKIVDAYTAHEAAAPVNGRDPGAGTDADVNIGPGMLALSPDSTAKQSKDDVRARDKAEAAREGKKGRTRQR